ncbi:D-alanyl-D-alanine carboxypeptidase family protein [Evansella clarkii]|jgi:D-alanyl-D-alanine carboxypeptidase/D-alanyl-D-alanine carboxypeptidase (penicillin-binding protein 5/6)|uniref:D-alanyl-D-alanine carboxypeptidase family protein n=1 Tax=Evansella clarkii TaxID=79879 RepID=UPI000997B0F7|nr:D-alanyl-D-alanine carboxypeptidase family protein [Evansella clarkii]
MKKIMHLMLITAIAFFTASHFSVHAHQASSPQLTSEAAILIDGKSGQVLYEKNAQQKMYPASITKIVTAIIAIEQGNLLETVTVSENATTTDGTRVYLVEDEVVYLERLVQGLMINSGNDAGTAIAEHIAGSEEEFAAKMNQFVREEIGAENSNFTNPHGLYHADHYTTAYDMAIIAKYAMQNETFKEIAGTKEMEWNGEGWETTIYNHHRLLWDYEGTTGVKNGFVSQAGFTLVTSAEKEGTELIAVTLKAPTAEISYDDTGKLLDYGFANYYTGEIGEDKVFESTDGQEYQLGANAYVTLAADTTMEKEVDEDFLVVRGDDGSVLLEKELIPLEDPSEIEEENNELNKKEDAEVEVQQTNWLQRLLSLFNF